MAESEKKNVSSDVDPNDPKYSLRADDIKKALWDEDDGKTPQIMRKLSRNEGLTKAESKSYRQAYRRVYSRRYRKLNRRKLTDYHNHYRATHKRTVRDIQRNYRNNPNNGYQKYIQNYRKKLNYPDIYKKRYPDRPDEKRREANRKYFRIYYARHPEQARQNNINSRRRRMARNKQI